jgi:hypothetical protein
MAVAPAELRARLQSAGELELNDIFTSEVVSFVEGNPREFVVLTLRKFVYFWTFSPQAGLLYPSQWLLPYQIYYTFAALLGLLGIARILQTGNPGGRDLLVVLATVSLTIAAIHALAYVEGRHRWGIEPLLLPLTAHGAVYLWDRFGRSRPATPQ